MNQAVTASMKRGVPVTIENFGFHSVHKGFTDREEVRSGFISEFRRCLRLRAKLYCAYEKWNSRR